MEFIMSNDRNRTSEMISALKQQRDEIAVRMHLAGMEVKQEWEQLDEKLSQLTHRFNPLKDAVGETADDVWESFKLVGDEIKEGFARIRKSL